MRSLPDAGGVSDFRGGGGDNLLNRHQVGGVSRSPDGLFAQQEGVATRGRPAVREQGTTRASQPTPHTNTRNPPRGAQVPPTQPSVPLHCHCSQQEHWPSRRPSDPTGGSAGRSDSQWASRAPEELRKMVSAHRGWGTQRANPGAPAAQRLRASTLRGTCTQWATTGAPDVFRAATSARRGSGTQGTNPGAPAAQRRCSSAPRGSHASGPDTRKHREAGCGRPEDGGVWTANTIKRPPQQPTQPQYANYWAPLTRKRHTMPHPAQPQHTNHWAPRTRKQHQQEHRPQWPTERSNPTQHAEGRTGDCPGPHKETTTRRNATQGWGQEPCNKWWFGSGSAMLGGGRYTGAEELLCSKMCELSDAAEASDVEALGCD